MSDPTHLIVYHSGEGQTEKIATRIAERLQAAGVVTEMVSAGDAPSPAGYTAVVAGDSIHAGHHSRELSQWLSRHADDLTSRPVALFQVSLTSASDDEAHTAEAHRLLQSLIDETGIDPDAVGLFAGALRYTKYGWVKRKLMQKITEHEGGGDTDTSRDYEYTDWDVVDHFADDVAALSC